MNYETLLREHHLKVTPQRLGLLSIMHTHGHVNVEDLFFHIKKSFASISLATLYKNINAMLENKLISEVKIPNRKAKYEIAKPPHIHMLCRSCHAFNDLKLDLDELVATASLKSHYKIEETNIILSGLCEHCQN
jgi:Fur family transcriptional regulator, peroxide stress response regulator